MAVIQRALDDITYAGVKVKKTPKLAAAAFHWAHDTQTDFEQVCEYAGLDPSAVRKRFAYWFHYWAGREWKPTCHERRWRHRVSL